MWTEVNPTTAPKPEPPRKQPCEHKWVFQSSDYERYQPNNYITEYKRTDVYYCEKCLEIREILVKQEEVVKSGIWVEKPRWFRE